MADRTENRKLIEQALKLTTEYVDLLKAWTSSRRASVKRIKETALKLQEVKQDVKMYKVVGDALEDVGVIVAERAVKGGHPAPLFVGGIATAVAGNAISAGAEYVGHVISISELQAVQEVLDADNKLTKEIEDKKAAVDVKVFKLSNILHLAEKEVFGALLMSSMPRKGFVNMNEFMVFQLLVSTGFVNMLHLSFQSGSIIGMGAFAEVSLEGLSKVLGTVLKVASGAMLLLDIYLLLTNSIELSKRSPSGAADSLREMAIQLEKQAEYLETSLKNINEEGEKYEDKVEIFRKLLEDVAQHESATDEEAKEIATFIQKHSSDAWWSAFQSLDVHVNLLDHAFDIARVFRNFLTIIKKYEEKKDKMMLRHLNITIIAHGGIDPTVKYPTQIYYMTQAMRSVCCYSPWGCSVDASVVYGIAKNIINIDECKFTGPVFSEVPRDFNMLPKSMELTPKVLFRPVTCGEGAHKVLMELARTRPYPSDGLVIPYFTGGGTDLLPFPEIPLWVCTNAIEIAALVRRITVSVRIASCLSPMDIDAIAKSLEPNGCFPNLTQYCQVSMKRPTTTMTTDFPKDMEIDAEEFKGIIQKLFQNIPEQKKTKKEEKEQQ